jgi:hypothetical protein
MYNQGSGVQVNRVSPSNTLKNENKVFYLTFVVQWYSIHRNTEEPIRQNASLASFTQTGIISQLVEAYARGERNKANNVWLAAAG